MVLLQMNSLVNMSRLLASAGLCPADLTAFCGFIWGYMFEVRDHVGHPVILMQTRVVIVLAKHQLSNAGRLN